MKKLVSMLLVLAMLVTVFAGLAITASAADAALTVCTQAGADGEKTLAKSYTAEELKKLAETKADGYGYQYFKKGEQDVVVTEYVTLDTLLTDADVTFADGDSLAFVCGDGPYTKFNPTYKDITEGKYSFKDGKGEEVPAAIALVWGMGAAADGTVADIAKTAKDTGSLRFVCGTTEADFTAEKAAGKRLPSGVIELIVVTAAKAEEKPAEEKPAEEKTGFTDVKDTDWFKADVEAAVELGLMTGTSRTTFAPAAPTTRGMMMTILARQDGVSTSGGGTWYEKGMAWAKENGISDGSAPNGSITREQLAVMLYRASGADAGSAELSAFADSKAVSSWAAEAMSWAVEQGVITGKKGNLLDPGGTASRAEVAVMLQRYLG